MAAPSYVYDLLASESLARWNAASALGSPITITYSFPGTQSARTSYGNFTPFTATEIAATRTALAYIASLTRITFVETTGAGAQLQFGNADLTPFGSGVSGRATYSYSSLSGITQATVVLANTGAASLTKSRFEPGAVAAGDIGGGGWQTLLHEIGHALGLKHPFETNAAGDPNSVLPKGVDDHVHTLMSYTAFKPANVAVVTGTPTGYSYWYSGLKPDTYGIYDIAALQYLYGAPKVAADKTYVLTPTDPTFQTLYDTGAHSTVDLSAFTAGCTVDMNPGAVNALPIKQALPFAIGLPDAYDGTAALTFAYGSAVARCIGGSGSDRITGNDADNVLDGRGGADTLRGGKGNDTYAVDAAGDAVLEAKGQGKDTVVSTVSYALAAGQEIETLQLARATGSKALAVTGNEFANALSGNNGANVLDGRAGADVLTGKAGADTFVFSTTLGAGNVDHVTDFSAPDDGFRLDDAVFTALKAGALAASAFKLLDGAKVDADDRILYKQGTGELFYDADGSGKGAAVLFAVLDNKAAITHADFFVV